MYEKRTYKAFGRTVFVNDILRRDPLLCDVLTV
jgi:hypothetical protein